MQRVTLAHEDDEWAYVRKAYAIWDTEPNTRVYVETAGGAATELVPSRYTLAELERFSGKAACNVEEMALRRRRAGAPDAATAAALLATKTARLAAISARLDAIERALRFSDAVSIGKVTPCQGAASLARDLGWTQAEMDAILDLPIRALGREHRAALGDEAARLRAERDELRVQSSVDLYRRSF
jgi:hypothetical protein